MAPTTSRTRLAPEERRAQLLDRGVELLSEHSLSEVTLDLLAEQAGVSRALIYHYFGNKYDVQLAIARRLADDLVTLTAPVSADDPMDRLRSSMNMFLAYLERNYDSYVALSQLAVGVRGPLYNIYEETRATLVDRVFEPEALADVIPDTPLVRRMVTGWSAFAENLALGWVADPGGIPREDIVETLTMSLPAIVLMNNSA